MALDSREMAERIAMLASEWQAERILFQPSVTKAWEFDKDGNIIKSDVSPLDVEWTGRRVVCVPTEPKGMNFWSCTLYDEEDNALRESNEQFPY